MTPPESALAGHAAQAKPWLKSVRTSWLLTGGVIVLCAAVVKLLIHLYAGGSYGYFIDELYYLACRRHLAWGYVDQPPMIAFVAWLGSHLFGESVRSIHILPALAGAGKVILTGMIAREMGGGRFAQGLAALSVLLSPGFLGMDNLLTMNVFEPLFWMGCAYVLIRIVHTGNQKLWLWAGLWAGLGLLNKHSMLIFGFGLIVGMLLTRERRSFASKWFWLGLLIAFLVFLPNLVWNIQHHFPFLELQANIRRDGRNVVLGPWTFFLQEVRALLPLTLPIWMVGLWFLFFDNEGKKYRGLGSACVITVGVIYVLNPRVYYVWPAVPLLMAGGSVQWERWLNRPKLAWIKYAYPALMVGMGALLAPMLLPVLPVEAYIRYAKTMHLDPPAIERWQLGPLPQIYASEFGWPEMVETVAAVYNSLPAEVRPRTAIFAQNFGQAGAIDLLGPKYGLPNAISTHQNYFLWGPRGYTGESVIIFEGTREHWQQYYANVEWRAHVSHPYSMPREHFDVFYCTGPKVTMDQMWPMAKNWH